MALEYREERNLNIEKQIEKLLENSPDYVKNFYKNMHNGKREITTQLSYIRDVINFIQYEKNNLKEFEEKETKDVPISVFDQLSLHDLNEYRDFLKKERNLANPSIKKVFASISAFYSFLNMQEYTSNNPMQFFEVPAVNKKKIIKLDSELSNKLLDGILSNDKYLIESDAGDSVIDIDDTTRIKRERLVLRNYAICCLFLGSGLRVSELVGLDLDDINFRQSSLTIIAKGGDETSVFFGEDVSLALRNYINGPEKSDEYKTAFKQDDEKLNWCNEHKFDTNFMKKLINDFPDCDESFKMSMVRLRNSLLRQGRQALNPKKGCDAVFITTRGTRMSVRSVELMIKEMVKTYLPEYDDKDKFSPHKLRATCATRILTQTGDIQLASTQLNHKGIAVTSAFYAELQKEKQKDKIKNLDINNW